MNKIKNWTKFNESNTYTYTLLNKNDEVVEIEGDDIDDANRKMMKLYKGTDPMLTHMNGKLIDWNRPTANFGAMKESNVESNVEFTVGKLIEELKRYDSNLPVRVGCHGYSNQEIVQIVEKPEYDNENEITILQINGNGSWDNQDEDDSYDDNGDNGVIHDEEFYPRSGRGK